MSQNVPKNVHLLQFSTFFRTVEVMETQNSLFYSTGEAAQLLQTSQDTIRRLCESGAIRAELTPGGQWRLPQSEVTRLKKEGLPPLPRPLPGAATGRPARTTAGPELPSFASPETVATYDETVRLKAEIEALRLRQEKEKALDWFRQREKEEQARRQEIERQRRLQAAKAERQRRHRLWFDRWQKHALDCIPFSARRQVEPDVYRAVAEVLDACTPEQDETITRQLVEAAARGVVKRWERERHVERLVADARDWWLPLGARGCGGELSRWQVAAVKAAREAIAALPADTPLDVMEAAARQAVARVAEQFRDYQLREELVHSCAFLRQLPERERQLVEARLKQALAQLPPGMPRALLEQARDEALKPIREAFEKQREAERREQEEAERRRRAEFRANLALSHLGFYLQHHKHFRYDGLRDLWRTTDELAKVLRPKLVEIILCEPDVSDEKLRRYMEQLAEKKLGLDSDANAKLRRRKRALH